MLRNLFIFIYVGISPIFLFPFGLLTFIFYAIGLKRAMSLVMYKIAQGWAKLLIKLSGCDTTVTGIENIPKGKEGVCFVSNHSGYFDIVLLLAFCGRPVGFVAKKELLLLPFINLWIFMIGGLFIDRTNPRKASRTISKGAQKIKKGGGMIIFPEGHRSKGRGLLPFHPGSLKLATTAEAVIVPVYLQGTYEFFEKNGRITKTSLKVDFLQTINTADIPSTDRKLILSNRIFEAIKERMDSTGKI